MSRRNFITNYQVKILNVLNEPMTHKGICHNLHIGHSSIYNNIKELTKLGFIDSFQAEDINFPIVTFYKRTEKGNKFLELFNGENKK